MGNTISCICFSKKATTLMGGPSEREEHLTASEREHAATASSLPVLSELHSVIEERIENSKCHWSELSNSDSNLVDKEELVAAEVENLEVFRALQMHPTWGTFFRTFGDGDDDIGSLVMWEKFAEGGQAELYNARVTWRNPVSNVDDLITGNEWVLKVFKKGTLLRHLQPQWPEGMLQYHVERRDRRVGCSMMLVYTCDVSYGTLLKDGRFAFLLLKEREDLRNRIDRSKTSDDCGPFLKGDAEYIMYRIAQGMDWLHTRNIIHRDLKASNVLCRYRGFWDYLVADYECSIGVTGTGFWRAPEILQACKDKVLSSKLELFTREADIYSYGMTCYEVLAGKLPFEGQFVRIDDVLSGKRPIVPEYVDNWARKLLNRCWQFDPAARPSIGEILKLLLANSSVVRAVERAESNPLWKGGLSVNRVGIDPLWGGGGGALPHNTS